MKFFSNDAKENTDEPYDREHSDVVTSEPVAVPQQRAGSPWSTEPAGTGPAAQESADAAGSPDDELADRERRDGTVEDRPDGTVSDDRVSDDTVDEPASRRDETDTLTTYHPDGTVETTDDEAAKDEGTFDSPQAVEPATGEPLSDETDSDPALRRDGVDEPGETVPVAAEATPEATPEPVAATPGSVPAPALDRLFADGDSFAERFREIQLRFVDSPKEATADAAALVGEAVDKLTGALKAQKDSLAGESDDTEQLRVQLRSYRDLLTRLSAL